MQTSKKSMLVLNLTKGLDYIPVTTSNDKKSAGHSDVSWETAVATNPRAKAAIELHLIFVSEKAKN